MCLEDCRKAMSDTSKEMLRLGRLRQRSALKQEVAAAVERNLLALHEMVAPAYAGDDA